MKKLLIEYSNMIKLFIIAQTLTSLKIKSPSHSFPHFHCAKQFVVYSGHSVNTCQFYSTLI